MPVLTEDNYLEVEDDPFDPQQLSNYRYRGPGASEIEARGLVPLKVSAAYMRQPYDGCSMDFIRDVCHGACCKTHPGSYPVSTVHPTEREGIEGAGVRVRRNLVVLTSDKRCPFHQEDGLCRAHVLGVKTFDCWVSPLIVNPNGTIIIANWFKSMPCFKAGRALPFYTVYPTALKMIFGDEGARALTEHLDAGGGDMVLGVTPLVHQKFMLERRAVGWSVSQQREERALAEAEERRATEARKAARAAKRQQQEAVNS